MWRAIDGALRRAGVDSNGHALAEKGPAGIPYPKPTTDEQRDANLAHLAETVEELTKHFHVEE